MSIALAAASSVLGKRGAGEEDQGTKRQRTVNAPSAVVFVRGVAGGMSEADLFALCAPFGRVVKTLIMQAKGQAFVQLESVAHATHLVTFYRNAATDPIIRGQSAKLDFSNHVSLEVSSSSSSSASAAGGAPSSGRLELAPNSIILIAIADQRIPVTVDHLAQALAQFGEVLKIVTFTKAGVFQALVQFRELAVAVRARTELDGKELFANGFCQMRIGYSELQELQVRGDTTRARDFTVPAIGFAGAAAAVPGFVQLQHGSMGHAGGAQMSQQQQQQAALLGMMGMPGMQGMMGMPGMQAMMGGAMGGAMGGDDTPVVLVSNLNADVVTPADLQVLFGVYGDVHRVKILFNKKDTALVQFATSAQAKSACDHLTRAEMFGRPISVRPSKHRDISMPRGLAGSADDVAAAALSVDFTDQPVHRFRNAVAAAHNAKNVCAPGPVLHLSSLPESATDQSIRELFAQYGQIVHFAFFQNDRRMAMLAFATAADAVVALIRLHNFDFGGKRIRVSFSSKTLAQLK